MTAVRSIDTYLGVKYRRIAARRGPMKALVAIEHSMLIAIGHMIADGNGRTGRILNILMLNNAGLLRLPILYLSRYIIEHTRTTG